MNQPTKVEKTINLQGGKPKLVDDCLRHLIIATDATHTRGSAQVHGLALLAAGSRGGHGRALGGSGEKRGKGGGEGEEIERERGGGSEARLGTTSRRQSFRSKRPSAQWKPGDAAMVATSCPGCGSPPRAADRSERSRPRVVSSRRSWRCDAKAGGYRSGQ